MDLHGKENSQGSVSSMEVSLCNHIDVIMHWFSNIEFILHFLTILTEEDSVLSLV